MNIEHYNGGAKMWPNAEEFDKQITIRFTFQDGKVIEEKIDLNNANTDPTSGDPKLS